jgi:hypothetical protein
VAKGFEFGLLRWGNGDICLTYWDSLHGHDVNFVINPDGTVDLKDYVDDPTAEDELAERRTPVTLGLALIALLERLEAEDSEEAK